jgi:sortase
MRSAMTTEAISDMVIPSLARLARLTSGLVMTACAALALAGFVLIGQGVWIHAKALLAQVLLERAFAQTLATGTDVKPWSWADTWPVARVEVPRLHKSAIVLAGSSGQALAFGPGQVERTPQAGESGTAIYSAHRDTHFDFLGDVAIGDEIKVTPRRQGAALPRRAHLGGALGRLRHRRRRRWPPAGAGDLLAARCRLRGPAALPRACGPDRGRGGSEVTTAGSLFAKFIKPRRVSPSRRPPHRAVRPPPVRRGCGRSRRA